MFHWNPLLISRFRRIRPDSVFAPKVLSSEPVSLVRRLPNDDKALQASAECQRNLDAAQESLRRFRSNWFEENTPELERAREAARDLAQTATNLRNAARDLIHLTSP
jgi:hypothetical protein